MEDRNKGIINYRWEDWDMAGSTLDLTLVEATHDPPAVLDVSIETDPREVSRDGLAIMHDIAEQVERAGGYRPAIDATPSSKPRITVNAEHGVSFPDVMEAILNAKMDHLAKEVNNGLLDEPG